MWRIRSHRCAKVRLDNGVRGGWMHKVLHVMAVIALATVTIPLWVVVIVFLWQQFTAFGIR